MNFALLRESKVVEIFKTNELTDDNMGYFRNFENVIECSDDVKIDWILHNNELVDPVTLFPTTKISKLKFRQRFTTAEMVGIFTAASSNYTLQVMLDNQRVSEYTDLSDSTLIAGLQYLVYLNLLTQQRYVEILTTPPTAAERYRG